MLFQMCPCIRRNLNTAFITLLKLSSSYRIRRIGHTFGCLLKLKPCFSMRKLGKRNNLCNWLIHVHNFQNIKIFEYDFIFRIVTTFAIYTVERKSVIWKLYDMLRSSHIYTNNHSAFIATKHETKCISGSSSPLCKGYRKHSARNVNVAAHTCVGLVPTCRMRELHSSSHVYGGVPRYIDNFTVRPTSRILILHFTQK